MNEDQRIKVTGYFCPEDHELDDGPNGPLTEEAFMDWRTTQIGVLDDLDFEWEDPS